MLEHITLCHKNHEQDNPSFASISLWINKLLAVEFKDRGILVNQISNSKYELINGADFISIKFFISNEKTKFPFNVRVPVEMMAYQQEKHPIMFLLHILDGIVDELEIYTADGSLINESISVTNVTHKVADILKD